MAALRKRTALISGASIAGPSLAFWLTHYGFEATVVEKASELRGGGYPIDVRGTAVDAAKRMGLLPTIQAGHINTQRLNFVDRYGRLVGSLRPETVTGGVQGRDYELPRGDLAAGLWDVTKDSVDYIFGDSIAAIYDHPDGVDVTFESGTQRSFDFVFGADGLHSNVRQLVFGPEGDYDRYLGWCFAGYTLPNDIGLSHESLAYNAPGKTAVIFAAGEKPERIHGFLNFAGPQPPYETLRDNEAMCQLVISAFQDDNAWEIPQLVAGLRDASDTFSDSVSQIYMPSWSKGRIALLGDAAHATSFLSGQGSSCALVTPYVLAGELASTDDYRLAFRAYERRTRPFVELNQAIATRNNGICMTTKRQIQVRDTLLRVLPLLVRLGVTKHLGKKNREATTALALPEYNVGTEEALA
jgi:2-polyprenyl-6-methoxyphenol hydroxylase-like FAD-dependent oxidoreductase